MYNPILSAQDLQQVKRSRKLTVQALQKKRDALERLARDHALSTALQYYEVSSEYLKAVVFENWLEEHAFKETFHPMKMMAR